MIRKLFIIMWKDPIMQLGTIMWINGLAYMIMRGFISQETLTYMATTWFHCMYAIAIPLGLILNWRDRKHGTYTFVESPDIDT